MDKLQMSSVDMTKDNIRYIENKFPHCITEYLNEKKEIVKVVNFELLQQELSPSIVDGREERYVMEWPDKKQTILSSNLPLNKTMRPNYDKSVDFENTKNLYIEGDNLDALKLLRETYMGKIKLIYIDPPYNAGQDIIYKNNYEISDEEFKKLNLNVDEDGFIMDENSRNSGRFHTEWLNMMYPRIKLAKDLLTDDGCMVIAIDHNELANTLKIADEIFSEYNRLGIVTVVHKPEGRNQERYFATSNEFALFYAKNKDDFDFEKVILDEDILKTFDHKDEKGRYKLVSFIAKNHGRAGYDKNLKINNPKNHFPIYVSADLKHISVDFIEGYSAVYPNTSTQERTWKYIRENCINKINENEVVAERMPNGEIQLFEKYRTEKGQLIKTHWIDKKYNATVNGTKLLDSIMGMKTFDFPKSLYLLKDIINLTTNKDSIILDFFSGSSTTAHAVMQLNAEDQGERKFIMVQLPFEVDSNIECYSKGYTTVPKIAQERLRRVGKTLNAEIGIDNKNIDTGFRVFEIDSSNMKDVYYSPSELKQETIFDIAENIKEDRTAEDLLFQVMLDMGVLLSSEIKTLDFDGKKVFNVNDGNLVCCFDKNLSEEAVTQIAKMKPLYAVFRDSSISSDSMSVNFDQIFETYSPTTTRKVL